MLMIGVKGSRALKKKKRLVSGLLEIIIWDNIIPTDAIDLSKLRFLMFDSNSVVLGLHPNLFNMLKIIFLKII